MRLALTFSRPHLRLAPLAIAALLAGCSSSDRASTEPQTPPPETAAQTADRIDHMADSVAASSGEAVATPMHGVADILRQAGTASPIIIRIDAKDDAVSAVGQEAIITGGGGPCPAPPVLVPGGATIVLPVCPVGPHKTRTLIAWSAAPVRIVQLIANGESGPIGTLDAATPSVFVPSFLSYMDGKGGFYWASSGRQANTITVGDTCPPSPPPPVGARPPSPVMINAACHLAQFTFELSAKVGPLPFPARGNTATGTHTLVLAKSKVAGMQLIITLPLPPPPPPPPTPSPLAGTLAATVGSVVTFTFTVANQTGDNITIEFPTTQEYDFVIRDTSGHEVWRWSAGKAFPAVVHTVVLAGHASITYTATWTPTAHGTFAATALLATKSSHVESSVRLAIP